MKRLFIAFKVELSEANVQMAQRMRAVTPYDSIVWVDEKIHHCTLRFIGKTPLPQIPLIKNILQEVTQSYSPFEVEIEKVGFFGSHYAPEVIWLGFKQQPILRQLFDDLENRLTSELKMEENYGNFVPHITLGRIKKVDNKKRFWQTMEQFIPASQKIEVKEIILFESHLEKTGPIYKEVAKYTLQK